MRVWSSHGQIRAPRSSRAIPWLTGLVLLAVSAGTLAGLPGRALAQGAAATRDEGQRIQQERARDALRERARKARPGLDIEIGKQEPDRADTRCFVVHRIDVEGITQLDESAVARIIASYRGRCLGVGAVNSLVERLNRLYVDKGLITSRAYIPEQDISTGVLRLVVIEGFIEAIRYREIRDGKVVEGPRSIIVTSMPTGAGRLLQLREIEQGLDQINRVPSSKATLDIKPGSKPGASVLEITNRVEDTVRGQVRYDYTHYDTVRLKRIGVSLRADNLLRLNDSWSLDYSGTQTSNALSYQASMPFRYLTMTSAASYSEQVSQLTSTSELFTQTASGSLSSTYLIHRDSKTKLFVEGGFTYRWKYRYINATTLSPQRLSIARIGGRIEYFPKGAYFSLAVGGHRGLRLLGANVDEDLTDDMPRAQFAKLDATGIIYAALGRGITLYAIAYGQYAPHALYAAEQLSIGGTTSVRGFGQAAAAGERGAYAQAELSLPLEPAADWVEKAAADSQPLAGLLRRTRLYLFADSGITYDIANEATGEMMSAGVGLRFNHEWGNVNVSAARPIAWAGSGLAQDPEGLEVNVTISVKPF